jgi:hypothetical protein
MDLMSPKSVDVLTQHSTISYPILDASQHQRSLSMGKFITLAVGKNLEIQRDPFNPKIASFFALVPITEAAKLDRGNANVRNPVDNRKPVQKMLHTIEMTPHLFHRKNKGITYLCSQIELDKKKGQLRIKLPQDSRARYGILDGGHTHQSIQLSIEKLELFKEKKDWVTPYVKVFIEAGEEVEEVTADMAESLNTSTAVQAHTLYDYRREFDDLKKVLKGAGIDLSTIAFREGELGKALEIREIIQRLACFHPKWKTASVTPVSMYRGRGKALEMYVNEETHKGFVALFDVLPDILTLPEYIQSEFSKGGILKGRKLGKLKVAKLTDPFVSFGGFQSEHRLDMAALLPMAAAFRSMLVLRDGKMKWKKNPKEIFRKVAPRLYDVLSNYSARAKTASQLGSDAQYWFACSQVVDNADSEE